MSNQHLGFWEKRWHPLREEWVVYSAHRNNRPWSFDLKKHQAEKPAYDPACYLCPDNQRSGEHVNPDYFDVFVFDNDFPVVGLEAPEISERQHDGLHRKSSAKGIARVVCYAREHNLTLSDVPPERMARVFEAWQAEMLFFEKHPDIHSVLIFENKGEIVGVSNPHPHCQIYAVDFPLQLIEREMFAAEKHHRRTGRNLFADIIAAESKDGIRIVAENDHALAFVPFFARYAYEVLIFPKKRHATLVTLSPEELHGMAAAYQEVIRRYDKIFDLSFPYVMNIHQAPVDGQAYPDYHFYVHFQPPLRQPGLPKYLAGPEIGAGNFMADTMPEAKAAELREVKLEIEKLEIGKLEIEKSRPISNFQFPISTASAPGRLDVMGGIADYSGSWVLQMPIQERTTVQAAFRPDDLLRVQSDGIRQIFELKINELPFGYDAARLLFRQKTGGDWAAYVLGCLLVLAKEKGVALRGIDFQVHSDVPVGKGVSSSAALEVAAMLALAQLYRLDFQGTEMAVLAQKAENLVVGSPCGLMDQLASCFGQAGSLLPIQCQPDRLFDLIKLPDGVYFVGLDSGVRHAVSGASYSSVRTAAFMGYSIIAQAEGCSPDDIRQARQSGDKSGLPFGGYLCKISPSDFEKKYALLLPEIMRGEDFLKIYQATSDSVTSVLPGETYFVKACARHPVFENFRVQTFAALLRQSPDPATLRLLGELMYQSHESYTACGLGNARTDELMAMVKSASEKSGVFGAKITGGGSGGTVCVLCFGEEGLAAAEQIFEAYRLKYGRDLKLCR